MPVDLAGAEEASQKFSHCLGMYIKAVTSVRPKTGRVGGLQGSGACDGVGTILLGSG